MLLNTLPCRSVPYIKESSGTKCHPTGQGREIFITQIKTDHFLSLNFPLPPTKPEVPKYKELSLLFTTVSLKSPKYYVGSIITCLI